MCKVVKGRMHRTEVNMDTLQGAPPPGCHSVYGIATPTGPLNYDELVVYDEAAILPWLKVTYEFTKTAAVDAAVPAESMPDVAPTTVEAEPEPQPGSATHPAGGRGTPGAPPHPRVPCPFLSLCCAVEPK